VRADAQQSQRPIVRLGEPEVQHAAPIQRLSG
jgi:hypothetical protein